MIKVITNGRIPVKMRLDDIEAGAMQQAINLARLPFSFHHIAIMPDAHQGYGMPIGGVMMLHSGSRNFGLKIAMQYHDTA